MEWFALYVKARHEFSTNTELQKKGIETFLPAVKRWRQWRDRKKLIEFPLFPGYLFVHIFPNSEGFVKALRTRGAVNLISAELGRPTSVPPEEMSSLRILIESGKELDIYPYFKEGTRVRVRRGILKGAEGVLARREDQYLFIVNIKLLGKSVGARIYGDDIEIV